MDLESAEKEVPGTMVRLGTPAIMGGKTALHFLKNQWK